MLGLGREFADRHVFDHAPAQRAHGLVGHGDAPVLSEVVETPRSQDRTPPCAIPLALTPAAVAYRASGLVLWRKAVVRRNERISKEGRLVTTDKETRQSSSVFE